MKAILNMVTAALLFGPMANGQLLKKLGDKVKNATDKAVDKAADKVLYGDKTADGKTPANSTAASGEAPVNLGLYAAYDFIPGDSVLFSDDMEADEANEVPSKWILDGGRAEVNDINGERMIAARQGTTLRPRMNKDSYLPRRFTIEYDVKYIQFAWQYGRSIKLLLANPSLDKNPDAGAFVNPIIIYASGEAALKEAKGEWPLPGRDDPSYQAAMKGWKHIAIAVNEKSVKVYVNQFRILNAQIEFGTPSSLIFNVNGDYEAPVLIKNFRIMAGGKSAAKQVTTNVPYIARGIQFEKGMPDLLPESMGEINNLVKLMKEDASIKFEIAGHTSAEASSSAEANQKLSEARATTVKEKMVSMGINANRLTAKGYGQNNPIANNNTPEGRATNRRVVFTKQ